MMVLVISLISSEYMVVCGRGVEEYIFLGFYLEGKEISVFSCRGLGVIVELDFVGKFRVGVFVFRDWEVVV